MRHSMMSSFAATEETIEEEEEGKYTCVIIEDRKIHVPVIQHRTNDGNGFVVFY